MIPISEQFLSFQGEGPFTGQRAVFLRTHGCNLLCGGGKYTAGARWVCDTIPVFMKIQKRHSPEGLLAEWREKGWLATLADGAHLVVTGGEPLMAGCQLELILFLNLLGAIFIEVETNGTIAPLPEFDTLVRHYNCSPKLAGSGMPRHLRRIPEVIRWHCNSIKSVFKFVIASPEDLPELIEDFVTPFDIPPHRIWLMPAAATRAELLERGPIVAKMAAHYGWNFSTRLHILLYDQACGV